MKKKLLSVVLALTMVATMLTGCAGQRTEESSAETVEKTDKPAEADDAGEITLAFVGPQTGDNAEYGKSMKTAAQIAIDEWNENGGVLGKQIKLVDYDDANSSEQAASIAEKIVGDDSISAVMGHFSSGVAMTAAEIYQEAGIALINGSAAHMDYAKIGDCIFRNNAIYTTDANTMLQIMEYLGVKKIGILNPNSDAGISVTSAVEEMTERYGDGYAVELVEPQLYEEGTVDFTATVAWFIEQGVEAVYSSGPYSVCAPFIQQYRAKDPDVKFVMSAACFSQEFLDLAGEDAEGVVIGTSFFYGSDSENVKNFAEKYKEVYGAEPSTFAAQVYDAAYAILYAIENGGSDDRADIAANLAATEFQGVTGKITFDEEGNCPKEQVLLEIKDGRYSEIPGVLMSQSDWESSKGF